MPIGQMRLLIKPLTILTFILAWTTVSAHKDRIEKPKTYRLTFQDGQTVTLKYTDNSLTTYCNDIVNGKTKLIKAELNFGTGETLTFEGMAANGQAFKLLTIKIKLAFPT
jgi:hypothetical protein